MTLAGYIDEFGKYHRGQKKAQGWDVNPTWKDWSHQSQRREFAKDIIQPHRNGKPNPKFVKAYPDVAKEYWSQETIDRTLRENLSE